ncbi:RNA methyltransferase [bacterium]|nr:RNA methyltransferase [bacterium]
MEITSVSNNIVKEYAKLQQKKYRNESGKFLLEGFKAIKEAYDFGIELEHVFVNKDNAAEYAFASNIIIETNEAVLSKLSTTKSAPNAVAVGVQKQYKKEDLKKLNKVVLLENIKDAGNLGTIIRSATAFGADGIVLYGDCVDLYNPKCVRSSVGNLWKLPIIHIEKFSELEDIFKDFNKLATLPKSKHLLKGYKAKLPLLVMFGSEADGLSEKLINFSTDSVKIEMSQTVESLNLATSVAVILYNIM